jgi:hypothetical protein
LLSNQRKSGRGEIGRSAWFATRPSWLKAEHWAMASILTALVMRPAFDQRKV